MTNFNACRWRLPHSVHGLHFHADIGPNAFALPGNDIVLLDELVTFADDDDVVLGVLAHGSAMSRNSTRFARPRSAVVAIGVSLRSGLSIRRNGRFRRQPCADGKFTRVRA